MKVKEVARGTRTADTPSDGRCISAAGRQPTERHRSIHPNPTLPHMATAVRRRVGFIAIMLMSACADPFATQWGDAETDGSSRVLHVVPAGGSRGVSLTTSIEVSFTRGMAASTDARVVLHRDSLLGRAVPGVVRWTTDRMRLTSLPAEALDARTRYVLHLGPDLHTVFAQRLSHEACRLLGGVDVPASGYPPRSATDSAIGPGMNSESWRAVNGSYGVAFDFVTR